MSTPRVLNREPAYQTIPGVLSSARFSARGDGAVVDRSKLELHLGAGPVYWPGGHLPEESENATFEFGSLTGLIPRQPAVRSIVLGKLLLEKLIASQDQEAVYFCGGLEAPADPQGPLMIEFALKMAQADVVVDANNFTGVLVGFKNGNIGLTVKFFSNGVIRKIELHDALYNTLVPPSPSYSVVFDWDQSQLHTYKLLWHPRLNYVKLYISTGQDNDTPDTLLIEGQYSDFLTALPPVELPAIQPVAYFGHGYAVPTSKSYWGNFYFHNKVASPVVQGLYQGGHTGILQTDEVILYQAETLPRAHEKPWPIIPASFGAQGGIETLTNDKKLWLIRNDEAKGMGFFRKEPSVAYGPSMFDFKVSGELLDRPLGAGDSTGMEVYVDDGVKLARFALLDTGVQSVGLLVAGLPQFATSYGIREGNWINESEYRIIFDPSGTVRLFLVFPADEGLDELLVTSVNYSALPASSLPGPGFGFLHNVNTVVARAIMRIGRLRYSTNLRYLEGTTTPASPWVANSAYGSVSSDGIVVTVAHTDAAGGYYFYRNDASLVSSQGFTSEFRARVSSYGMNDSTNPIRKVTGVGAEFDDGTYRYSLVFAEMGPPIGKIVFLANQENLDLNLLDIRAGKPAVKGSYSGVDWSIYHLYRLEKTVGGNLSLRIDDANDPVISFETSKFTPPPSTIPNQVRFGSLLAGRASTSQWKFLRHSISEGLDVSAFPVLTDSQVNERFDNALNTIAEVWIP